MLKLLKRVWASYKRGWLIALAIMLVALAACDSYAPESEIRPTPTSTNGWSAAGIASLKDGLAKGANGNLTQTALECLANGIMAHGPESALTYADTHDPAPQWEQDVVNACLA